MLEIPAGLVPSPMVTYAFTLFFGETTRFNGPGEVLRTLLSSAPPLLSVGALRMFAELRGDGIDEKIRTPYQQLWTAVRKWSEEHQEHGGTILAAIGTWASKPNLVEALDTAWTFTQLEEIVREYNTLDVSSELFTSFGTLVERSPDHADRVAELVLLLRHTGLLEHRHGRALSRFVDTLTETTVEPALLSDLRSMLTADRLIGPLSTW